MIITKQLGFHICKFPLHIQIVRNGTVNLRCKSKGYAMDNKASHLFVIVGIYSKVLNNVYLQPKYTANIFLHNALLISHI